jgi:hypothetical protein
VLQTKGTAALVLGATPDSTATGGNVRGANAVDLQTIRSAAAQVASGGNANIGGGLNNTASGTAATVAGGSSNTASAGNSTVAGGNSNTASGTGSFAAGVSNTAGGSYSSAPGGTQASAHGIYGAQVFATGFNVAQGDAQAGLYVLRGRSSAGAAVRLTADGTGTAGSVNVANLPLNTAWSGDMLVTARDTTTGNCCRWRISFGLGCAATAATTAYAEGSVEFANIIGSVAATANLVRSADTTNRGINLTFTPANSNTWDLVAVMRTAEVQ